MALLGPVRGLLALLALASGLVAVTAGAIDGDRLEYAVKASYLTKFGPFIQWPPGALGDGTQPLRICVIGADPFGPLLDEAARGQRVQGHPLAIAHMDTVDGQTAAACRIMFVGQPTGQSTAATLHAAAGAPVLTVTDRSHGVSGGIIDFVLQDGRLLVNEIAPRPHNSGHYSIDACVTSQFEQQARVMACLPLGSTRVVAPSVMLNILGDIWFPAGADTAREPDWAAALAASGSAKLHLYGKREARRGRKMGHVTIVGQALAQAQADAARVAAALGMPAP